MSKMIVVFCEGDHDIAFLSRLLFVNSFEPYRNKVKDFIPPLNKLYMGHLEKKKIEDTEFKFQKSNEYVPYVVLFKEDTLILFHNLNGDGNILNKKAEEIKEIYLSLVNGDDDFSPSFDYRFLYFLDSDNEGVDTRVEELKDLLSIDTLEPNNILTIDKYEVGCHIFHDEQSAHKQGKLEDILLSLMIKDNETIFEDSRKYIDKNFLEDTNRQKKYFCTSSEQKYVKSVQYKEQKSIISIAGQLQFSGSSNAVIIANSDFITKDDLTNSSVCQDIIKLFN